MTIYKFFVLWKAVDASVDASELAIYKFKNNNTTLARKLK